MATTKMRETQGSGRAEAGGSLETKASISAAAGPLPPRSREAQGTRSVMHTTQVARPRSKNAAFKAGPQAASSSHMKGGPNAQGRRRRMPHAAPPGARSPS